MSTHRKIYTALAGLAFLVTALPAAAKPTPKPKVKTPTANATMAKPSAAHGPKTTTAHMPKAKVKTQTASSTAKAVKPTQATTAKGQGKTKSMSADKTTGSTRTANADTKPTNIDTKPGNMDTKPGTNDTIPTTEPANLSKAQQKLLKNENLRLKMLDRLPPDTKVIPAAAGFKNLGQFIAAVNVSHNQGIDFFALKALMTGPQSLSLGQAIQQLKGTDPTTARMIANNATATADNAIATAEPVPTQKTKRKDRD